MRRQAVVRQIALIVECENISVVGERVCGWGWGGGRPAAEGAVWGQKATAGCSPLKVSTSSPPHRQPSTTLSRRKLRGGWCLVFCGPNWGTALPTPPLRRPEKYPFMLRTEDNVRQRETERDALCVE